MKNLIRFKHARDYYWGLVLLLMSSLSLVWALLRDAFKPSLFLVQVLLFSWGYALLWRNDLNVQIRGLQTEVADLKERLSAIDAHAGRATWPQEPDGTALQNQEAAEEPPLPETNEALLPNEF